MNPPPTPTILIISQVYPPDPTSVGQHVADAAEELVARGYRVVVLASGRDYARPSIKYPRREIRGGVTVRRLPLSSLGKSRIAVRLVAQCIFVAQAMLRGLFTRNLAGVLVSTSPPFCGVAGVFLSALRRVPLKYWLMDLNPDQVIAMGRATPRSLSVRLFELANRSVYRRAMDIVMLDRFMLERAERKGVVVSYKTTVMPPWPMEDDVQNIPHDHNPFRIQQNLTGKFVIMYSGNHSPANPLATLLDAALQFESDDAIVFLFIGGGSGKKEVDARIAAGAKNIRSLPYQPLDQIRYSLSAADVHVVSMGDDVVGIVHPCKVYGALAVSRPILHLGPSPCHVSDIIARHDVGWHVNHGDVDGMVRAIRTIRSMPREQLHAMGGRAGDAVSQSFSRRALRARFCDVVVKGLRTPRAPVGAGANP